MISLYAISNEYQSILNQLEEEKSHECLQLLEEIQGQYEDKVIAVAAFIKNLQAEKTLIETAIKDMQERKINLERKLSWVEKYLIENMERCGISEISQSPYFKIKLKKCPISVEVIDEHQVPHEYKKIKEVVTIDKIKAKEDLNQGLYIEGLTLKRNLKLEIK